METFNNEETFNKSNKKINESFTKINSKNNKKKSCHWNFFGYSLILVVIQNKNSIWIICECGLDFMRI